MRLERTGIVTDHKKGRLGKRLVLPGDFQDFLRESGSFPLFPQVGSSNKNELPPGRQPKKPAGLGSGKTRSAGFFNPVRNMKNGAGGTHLG